MSLIDFEQKKYQAEFIESIVLFVYREINVWRDYPSRTQEIAEPKNNANLVKYLTQKAHKTEQLFLFNHEEPQEGKYTIDLSAYPADGDYNNTITVFECKRLSKLGKNRDDEYVTGHKEIAGGIQRLKLGVHGKEHEIVGMIGYVESGTLQERLTVINNCIDSLSGKPDEHGLIWGPEEHLNFIDFNEKHRKSHSRSVHPRKPRPLVIHHVWVDMQKT